MGAGCSSAAERAVEAGEKYAIKAGVVEQDALNSAINQLAALGAGKAVVQCAHFPPLNPKGP
jgi:hypothetical protein